MREGQSVEGELQLGKRDPSIERGEVCAGGGDLCVDADAARQSFRRAGNLRGIQIYDRCREPCGPAFPGNLDGQRGNTSSGMRPEASRRATPQFATS